MHTNDRFFQLGETKYLDIARDATDRDSRMSAYGEAYAELLKSDTYIYKGAVCPLSALCLSSPC